MPLMSKIMKKYEQEAQQKIAEAQEKKKEEHRNRYSDKDGGEILHDPYDGEEDPLSTEGAVEVQVSEENGKEEKGTTEKVLDLHEEIEKVNESLSCLRENAEVVEELQRLRRENEDLKQRVKELEGNEATIHEENTESFY